MRQRCNHNRRCYGFQNVAGNKDERRQCRRRYFNVPGKRQPRDAGGIDCDNSAGDSRAQGADKNIPCGQTLHNDAGNCRTGNPAQQKAAGAALSAKRGDTKVGDVTSGAFGPSLEGPMSMGYVATVHSRTGTRLQGDVRGNRMPVTVGDRAWFADTTPGASGLRVFDLSASPVVEVPGSPVAVGLPPMSLARL